MLIHIEDFTTKNLQVGQLYRIQMIHNNGEYKIKRRLKAELIGQTKYFFIFRRKAKSSTIKETISKFDWYKDPDLIRPEWERRRKTVLLAKRCYKAILKNKEIKR